MRTPKFKVGDRVRRINEPSPFGAPVGAEGRIVECGGYHWVHWDCGAKDANGEANLEPITNDTMSDELKVTKAAVLEAASKCGTAKATLQVLFPDAFKKDDELFGFSEGDKLSRFIEESVSPLYIGDGYAPMNIRNKCLIVNDGWEVRKQKHKGRTILTFHRNP